MTEKDVEQLENRVKELENELRKVKNNETDEETGKKRSSSISRRDFLKKATGGTAALGAAAMLPSATGFTLKDDKPFKFGNLSSSQSNFEVATSGKVDLHGNNITNAEIIKANSQELRDWTVEGVDQNNGDLLFEHVDGAQGRLTTDGNGNTIFEVDKVGSENNPNAVEADPFNGVRHVRTRSGLLDALGSDEYIALRDDLTMDGLSPENLDLGSADVHLDLRGHTITRADDSDTYLLDWSTTGNVTIQNGVIDGNRRNQTYEATDSYHEILVRDCESLMVRDLSIVDNFGFSIKPVRCNSYQAIGVDVDTYRFASSSGDDGQGLDGHHPEDCNDVSIVGGTLNTGDDAISVEAQTQTVERVAISGVTVPDTENGSGVKLYIDSAASGGTTVRNASIDVVVGGAKVSGIVMQDDAQNGDALEDISIYGTFKDTTDSGIKTQGAAINNLTVDATVVDSGLHGLDGQNGGSEWTINGTFEGHSNNGIVIDGVDYINVGATCNNNGAQGTTVKNGSYGRFNGEYSRNSGAGIFGSGFTYATVGGSVISNNSGGAPVDTFNSSDHWVVVGNVGTGNSTTSPSLDGANNVNTNNNFS